MKKKKNNKKIDKEKQEEKVVMENYWDVFVRNYRNVPAFKSLVKLIIYFILIALFIIVASSGTSSSDSNTTKPTEDEVTTTTTTPEKVSKNYKDMLDDIINSEKEIYFEIKGDDGKYIIDAKINKGIMEGYYTSSATTKKFIIENNKIYEVNVDERLENNSLFTGLNNDYIIQQDLISIIKNNVATKELKDGETIYNYNLIDNENNCIIKTFTKDDVIKKIEIVDKEIEYNISYK